MELECRGLMGLSEQMLRMSGIGGLQLGPIRWQGKANGKSVPPVDTPLPLQQVGMQYTSRRDNNDYNNDSKGNNKNNGENNDSVNKLNIGRSVSPVDTPLPLQQVSTLCHINNDHNSSKH